MPDRVRAVTYQRRVVDAELDALTAAPGGSAAVALDGAKAVGKTATASERAAEIFLLEDPFTRQLLEADPSRILSGRTVLIDEWQRLASTWDVVRRAVDAGARPGQFWLTGSASARNPGTHSGAGRILKVRMRPMTLAERGIAEPTVSVGELLSESRPRIGGQTTIGLTDYVEEIVNSGFPAIRALAERARRAQLQGYIERVIDREIPDATGRSVRNPTALRRWLAAYAAATGTVTSYEKIRDAASAGETDKPAKTTTSAFRDALEALYVLDPVPAWAPTRNHIAELAAAPKHHLVDPALAASALGLATNSLLAGEEGGVRVPRDGTFLGALFESLAVLSLRVFAQAAEASVGHLRTHRGEHEIDLIVERADRRVVAFEMKLSRVVEDDDVKHLHWLRERIGDELLDAIVVNTGPFAYRREDGIAVVPACLLGP